MSKRRLQKRAFNLAKARAFFAQRNICEVDCIALGQSASTDVNIDLFEVPSSIHGTRYLFSSPEYPMKRLLSEGSGDIYYLGHVWRHEEAGRNHSPEFLMAEWYRIGCNFEAMIQETLEFVQLFIGTRNITYVSYQEAFTTYLHINPYTCNQQELELLCSDFKGYPIKTASRDDLLNLLFSLLIEPHFCARDITVVHHYPASQAALAQHSILHGQLVAERFELFCENLELANGYHELTNADEQRTRCAQDNADRILKCKNAYPVDNRFLTALDKGLPNCSGVAVGFDRLLMIEAKASTIDQVLPIAWSEA